MVCDSTEEVVQHYMKQVKRGQELLEIVFDESKWMFIAVTVSVLPFRLHLLLAESNPTFPCNGELFSSHIGLRLLETNLELLSASLFLLPLLKPTIVTWWQVM